MKKIMKKNDKGFTLVELIVVLVILAILAAILVPALLGYIDKARQAQYEEEAHAILTATQAKATEEYAKGVKGSAIAADSMKAYVNPIVAPTVVDTIGNITYGVNDSADVTYTTSAQKDNIVQSITGLKFKSQNGKNVTCDISGSSITIISVTD